jgi:hypothetical protein
MYGAVEETWPEKDAVVAEGGIKFREEDIDKGSAKIEEELVDRPADKAGDAAGYPYSEIV